MRALVGNDGTGGSGTPIRPCPAVAPTVRGLQATQALNGARMARQATKRHDPPSVRADGHRRGDTVLNARPDFEYRLANPNDDRFGLAALLDQGWETVPRAKSKEDEQLPYRNRGDGDHESFQGMILVRKLHAEYVEQDEAPAREKAKAFEKHVRDRRGVDDPMRGFRRAGVSFNNETSAPEERRMGF